MPDNKLQEIGPESRGRPIRNCPRTMASPRSDLAAIAEKMDGIERARRELDDLWERVRISLLIRGLWPEAYDTGPVTNACMREKNGELVSSFRERDLVTHIRFSREDGQWRDIRVADLPGPLKAIWINERGGPSQLFDY